MDADIARWWQADLGAGPHAEKARDALLSRYREPHRQYHGVRHVKAVRRSVGELLRQVEVEDSLAVRLAAWYHDAVYDPRSSTNEADSAALARRGLEPLGVADATIARTEALVLSTISHMGMSPDEAVLGDADLGVLGADPAAYGAYVIGVRAEYAFVDDDAWRVGRARVLKSFLDRAVIFRTEPMRYHEPRARANLAAELATLAS